MSGVFAKHERVFRVRLDRVFEYDTNTPTADVQSPAKVLSFVSA